MHVRDAVPEDAAALVEVWTAGPDPASAAGPDAGCRPEVLQETAAAVARISADPEQRIVVALVGDRVAGAVQLARGPLSPVQQETAVHVIHLHVLDRCRRQGVGHALMEAAVAWAEEKDTTHLLAAASVGSRDANRFMARLGLAQVAVLRGTTVGALRAKLPPEPPAVARVAGHQRSVGQVLAARRSLRRSRSRAG